MRPAALRQRHPDLVEAVGDGRERPAGGHQVLACQDAAVRVGCHDVGRDAAHVDADEDVHRVVARRKRVRLDRQGIPVVLEGGMEFATAPAARRQVLAQRFSRGDAAEFATLLRRQDRADGAH